jgi:hypothetical protein
VRHEVGVQMVKGDAFLVSYVSNDAQTAKKVTGVWRRFSRGEPGDREGRLKAQPVPGEPAR